MGLFKADFYRFFAIGFAVGAVLVFGTLGGGSVTAGLSSQVVPAAVAAQAE
jgi:hypothetical protein